MKEFMVSCQFTEKKGRLELITGLQLIVEGAEIDNIGPVGSEDEIFNFIRDTVNKAYKFKGEHKPKKKLELVKRR